MKNFLIITTLLLLTSCNIKKEDSETIISRVQNSKFELFNGVTIEARNKKDDVFKAPFLTKDLNGVEYLLPNFSYYGCSKADKDCLSNITNKEFDIVKFSKDQNKGNINAYQYSYDYTLDIFNEYEKIRVNEILSKSSIGNCIIFYLDKYTYLAYVPNMDQVINKYWQNKFSEATKVDDKWYVGSK